MQKKCQIVKKIGGTWQNNCGFLDGEKFICMDVLYDAIQRNECLVYSFGLANDWNFEVFMAKQGMCILVFESTIFSAVIFKR